MKTGMMAMVAAVLAMSVMAVDDVPPDIFPTGSRILFQGDSITHGGRRSDMNHYLGHGYQAVIAMRYLAAYPEKKLEFLNRGVSGDTTEKMLARWDRDAISPVGDETGYGREFGYTNQVVSSAVPFRPDYLSILVGVNDQDKGMSTETYASNLVRLVERSLAANPKLKIILGEPFRCPRSWAPEYAKKQAFVRRLAKERGFAFVPYQELFDRKLLKLNPDPAYWSWDGGHPTYAAHLHMANLWLETVAKFYGNGRASSPREPIRLKKLGTYDIFIVEGNPVVFKGRLWMMEYIRWMRPDKKYRFNETGDSYFRFRSLEDMKTMTPAFGKGLHMGNAFVAGDKVVVTAVENWGKGRFYIMESPDLEHWSEPKVILEDPRWEGYNTTMCRAGDRYVLGFELGAPKEEVGEPFTMFFAESPDLKNWKLVKGAKMGRDIYTGAPMLRYHAGWFYFFHLEGSYEHGFETRVMRSKDLFSWERSPEVVLGYDPWDKMIHPSADFTDAEKAYIAGAKDINASDLDMCEWQGRLVCFYSWGNQRGNEFSALAEADCTEREFCESFFGH